MHDTNNSSTSTNSGDVTPTERSEGGVTTVTRAQLRDQLLDADITNSERDIPEPLQEVWEDITDRVKVILDWNTQGKSLGASTFLVEMESKKLIDAAREQWLDIARMYLDALDSEGGFDDLHAHLDAAGVEFEVVA